MKTLYPDQTTAAQYIFVTFFSLKIWRTYCCSRRCPETADQEGMEALTVTKLTWKRSPTSTPIFPLKILNQLYFHPFVLNHPQTPKLNSLGSEPTTKPCLPAGFRNVAVHFCNSNHYLQHEKIKFVSATRFQGPFYEYNLCFYLSRLPMRCG